MWDLENLGLGLGISGIRVKGSGIQGFRDSGFRDMIPILENKMHKNMENDMETGVRWWTIGVRSSWS